MTAPRSRSWWVVAALVVGVTLGLGSLASGLPDGLEWTAERLGFAPAASGGPASGLVPVGGPLAGLAGVLVVLALTWGVTRLVRRA